jgi:hypothetical protein
MWTFCHNCRKSVYFVQFWGAGSAYLDRLGPPWTVHRCMAKCGRPASRRPSAVWLSGG